MSRFNENNIELIIMHHMLHLNDLDEETLTKSITFNNKIANTPKHIANCFTKQFTNTIKHATHKTNRSFIREIIINNNNNNCLKSNIQCIEIRVQWTVHLTIVLETQ